MAAVSENGLKLNSLLLAEVMTLKELLRKHLRRIIKLT